MLEDEQVRLTISGRFTLEQVGEAQAQRERGGSQGKLLFPFLKKNNETLSWWAAAYTA